MAKTDVLDKATAIIAKVARCNRTGLEGAMMCTITPSYPFSTSGLYPFIGKPESRKTMVIIQHALMC